MWGAPGFFLGMVKPGAVFYSVPKREPEYSMLAKVEPEWRLVITKRQSPPPGKNDSPLPPN